LATPSQLRVFNTFIESNFTPAQLHIIIQRLFGPQFVNNLPGHQHTRAAEYFFEVTQQLGMNGFLNNNKMGQALFAELLTQRSACEDEIRALAAQLGITVPAPSTPTDPVTPTDPTTPTSGPAADPAPSRPSQTPPATSHPDQGLAPVSPAKPPPVVRLTLKVENGRVTAERQAGDQKNNASAPLPTDTFALHTAQTRLRSLTADKADAEQIAEASMTLGTALSQHLFQAAIQTQFALALNDVNHSTGELDLQLEFGGAEDLAQLSWELVRAPDLPHGFVCTLPGVMLTRRYHRSVTPFKPLDTPKKLLIVLGSALGRPEALNVKKIWEDNGLVVQLLEMPGRYELSEVLLEGPWDVVHIISHGVAEKVLLKDTLNASQLAHMVQGHVRTAIVLSVCDSSASTDSPEQVAVDAYDRGSVAWRGVAQALIGVGVPNVIAWSNGTFVDECARITPRWHAQYLKNGDARKATQKARQAILSAQEYSFGWLVHFSA
jgi:hypothetical protein